MTDRYTADTGQVKSVGETISRVSGDINSARQYGAASGAEPYPQLTGAVNRFCDAWDNAVSRLVTSSDDLGHTTTKAGVTYEEYDQELGRAWTAFGDLPRP